MLETFKVHLLYQKSISSGTDKIQPLLKRCHVFVYRFSGGSQLQVWLRAVLGTLPCLAWAAPRVCPRLSLMEPQPLQSRQELLLCPRSDTAGSPQCDRTAPGQREDLQRPQQRPTPWLEGNYCSSTPLCVDPISLLHISPKKGWV